MKLTDLFEFGGSAPAKTGKVQRVSGNKVTMADPKTPGVTTTVDLTKMDIDTSDPKNPTVKPKNNKKSAVQTLLDLDKILLFKHQA